ncbi:MAG: ATP-binding protein [Chitinophagaceae bacterium]
MKEASSDQVQLLVTTVQQLSLARDLDTVMRIVRSAARNLTGADGATFVLKDNGMCYYADEDAISPLWKGSRFPMSACVSGWAMINKQPAVISDIYADSRIPADAYRPTFVKSLLMVPIRTIDPIGAIGNYWASQRQPTEGEVWLLQSLADITAVTMENVNVYGELEKRVQERTMELEQANKGLEAFSYTVSHDLQAPLRIINGYASILQEDYADALPEEGKKLTKKIKDSGNHLSLMINHLLDFFRTGKQTPQKTVTGMSRMVNEISTELKQHEAGRKIRFSISDLPDAEADPMLIKQVWMNLLSNAVKYTQKKSEAVIEVGAEKKAKEYVYHVKDNGAGFDMRYYDKLFGVFQRLHSPKDFEGSGIGLATVQKIVNQHGGKIWAEAKPGEGASFYFSLPEVN